MAARALVTRWALRLLPVAILAAGVVGFIALKATKPVLSQNPVAEKVWPVQAAYTEPGSIQPDLLFYGQVVAGREVELRPLVAGRVVEVNPAFRDGGQVAAGDMLIRIDPFTYESAVAETRADLAEARARLSELETDLATAKAMLEREESQEELRQRDMNRYTNLRDRGAASSKAYDEARLALLAANERVVERRFAIQRWEATYQRQQAVVERLAVGLARAERDLAETELDAPFGGYLADIGTELGRQVSQADRVARLIDASRLEVRFHVDSRRFGEMAQKGGIAGRPVSIVWRLQGRPLEFSGTLTRTGAEIDPASGGVAMYAELREGEALNLLRPGAFVEVRTGGTLYEQVVRLPESAWHDGHVFIIRNGVLAARPAELVRRVGQDVLLRGDFADAEPILVTPVPGAADGMRVQIVADGV